MPEPRVIVALAVEEEHDFIWDRLRGIQSDEGALASRPFISTRWATDPDEMHALIDHARTQCVWTMRWKRT